MSLDCLPFACLGFCLTCFKPIFECTSLSNLSEYLIDDYCNLMDPAAAKELEVNLIPGTKGCLSRRKKMKDEMVLRKLTNCF